ncbi:uncharacterized protein Z519_00378 [Cladophialophora bantiana CBS 173.52]|uniref:WD repeat protein n=1 Tax=Cladophialophora bantiana (strain ATCC 10958 / CBS 173.52 / CDC B-1940 / NIH 8579) TaxID=1442370 RepID=A0A0D2F9E7_CLAB1|nr:uncharacterized protein Z519_00378 [Cladophialophora bantiana CBS 173.52]KIW98716.1 hypothetical protein Z519_00378 [Cladophialophora bantiana CBS 173.52]
MHYRGELSRPPTKPIADEPGHKPACLPVTALRSVLVDGELLVLAGQGPFLHIYDESGAIIISTRIFEIQPVCGVQTDSKTADQDEAQNPRVVFWGGALLRLGRLTIQKARTASPHTVPKLILSRQLNCRDWILDAAIHESCIFILTAHNQLQEVPVLEETNEKALECGKPALVIGPRSFLYSGSLFVAQPGLIVVASGTVFGEILVWICSRKENDRQWSPSLRHVFNGHRGSVFGVSISDVFELGGTRTRLLASCSDDRTVRIWYISDCEYTQYDARYDMGSTETGFGHAAHGGENQIASAWGHLSRIWGVQFVQEQVGENGNRVWLLSRGEDGACQLWTIELPPQTRPESYSTTLLRPESSDRHHFGKNAWSISCVNAGQGLLVHTGGADGQIISRKLDIPRGSMGCSLTLSVPFAEITGSSMALKNYLLVDSYECLATTDKGDLFRVTAEPGGLNWNKLMPNPRKGGLVLCPAGNQQLVLAAYQRGGLTAFLTGPKSVVPVKCDLECGISWMQLASQQSMRVPTSTTCVIAVLANKHALILWVSMKDSSVQVSQTCLRVPETFIITSCCYDSSSGLLLLGSRAGALAVYSHVTAGSETSGEPRCLRHVHGTDSVTSISVLRQDPERFTRSIHVLTTGRDGIYAIHRVNWLSSGDGTGPTVSIVHLSAPPFGPSIEGAFFTSTEGSPPTTEPDLVLYGFRSTFFVVWNETQQSEVLAVECGGSHRSWSFRDSSMFCDSVMKSFVWTKAGRLNWHSAQGSSHKVLQKGGHGREIKAVARSPLPYTDFRNEGHARVLIATGAEDTNIQLFAVPLATENAYRPQPAGNLALTNSSTFRAISTLKRHNTGIQHLLFSPIGGYLFSSAGCEEFYVWKLSFNVPGIEAGVVLWDVMPTEEEDSDARIMSFDLRCASNGTKDANEVYTIVMAYSNGKIKVVRYTPAPTRNQEMFETLREISYGSFCVMQALFLSPSFTLTSTLRLDEHQIKTISAGTNGFLNLSLLDSRPLRKHLAVLPHAESPLQTEVHKVHQSSVLAIDIVSFSPKTFLIATGGDDNALGLTLLTSRPSLAVACEESDTQKQLPHHFRTIVIPAAHAAALTALKITDPRRTRTGFSVVVVTVGNDQRVRVWNVHVRSEKNGDPLIGRVEDDQLFEAIQVKPFGSGWTAVADVSGLQVLEDDQGISVNRDEDNRKGRHALRILVVGVGMELLNIDCGGDAAA